MAVYHNDTFDEGSNTAITSHTPNLGAGYAHSTIQAGTAGTVLGGVGVVEFPDSSVSLVEMTTTPGTADYTITGTLRFASSAPRADLGLRLSGGTGYTVFAAPFGTGMNIVRHDGGGSFTVLNSNSTSFDANADYAFSLGIAGSTITWTLDGVTLTATDSTYTAAGRGGFGGRDLRYLGVTANDSTAGDTTPPTITGPGGATGSTSSVSVAENTTAVHTFTANESVTWSLNGGADVARFTINSGTGALAFLAAPDFETPTDADTNNTYIVGVRATDAAGNATTQTCTVTVTDVSEGGGGVAPSITTHPSNQTVTAGATATFTAAATGTPTPTVQWQRNGSNISGATSTSYTTPATTVSGGSANNGDTYRAVFTNASGSVTSNSATLTVNAASGGTLTLTGFKTWTGVPYTSTTVNFVKVCRISTGATVLELTGQSINASGNMSITSASLSAAVDYMVFGFNADGSLSFKTKATAV